MHERPRRAGNLTGTITPAERQWFAARGPGDLVSHIHIPTLIVQGTVDTLFTLQEGVENYEILRNERRAHLHDLVLRGPRRVPDPSRAIRNCRSPPPSTG